jgi:hypothetical protein
MLTCVQPYTDTLTSIDLDGALLSYGDFRVFLDVFSHKPNISKVNIGSRILSLEVVDMVASCLPGVEDLTLSFEGLVTEGDVPDRIYAKMEVSLHRCQLHHPCLIRFCRIYSAEN